jgi:flavodoxin
MWIVVGMASSQKMAQAMQKGLESEGILVKLRNVSSKTKRSSDTYEILVLESESDAAREILIEKGY